MKIGIDARFFGNASKGLGRYTEQLIRHLETVASEHEFVIFMRSADWDVWTPTNSKFRKVRADIQWYSLQEQTVLPRILKSEACDLYHFPHFNVPLRAPRPFIATVHDLILSHFPTVKATTLGPVLYWFKHQMYQVVMRHALKSSSHIISVSKYTKQDICNSYHIPEEKISVTYEGVDTRLLAKQGEDVTHKMRIPEKFLLYVGNAYPHKNLEQFLLAFKKIAQRFPDLGFVLVGKHDFFYKRTIAFAREQQIPHVFFPGYVSDAELANLYSLAKMYVFPSKYEGFGLPPLEAMAHGTPVASSNSSCLPEILGDAAAYFSPEKRDDMIHVVTNLLEHPEQADMLAEKGKKQYQKYSWERMAKETLSVYSQSLYER